MTMSRSVEVGHGLPSVYVLAACFFLNLNPVVPVIAPDCSRPPGGEPGSEHDEDHPATGERDAFTRLLGCIEGCCLGLIVDLGQAALRILGADASARGDKLAKIVLVGLRQVAGRERIGENAADLSAGGVIHSLALRRLPGIGRAKQADGGIGRLDGARSRRSGRAGELQGGAYGPGCDHTGERQADDDRRPPNGEAVTPSRKGTSSLSTME